MRNSAVVLHESMSRHAGGQREIAAIERAIHAQRKRDTVDIGGTLRLGAGGPWAAADSGFVYGRRGITGSGLSAVSTGVIQSCD